MLKEIDLTRADLNLLVMFDVVWAERHVGRAAGRLNISPSAVSHGLGRLRRLLNDPLFLKTPKGVVPTDRAAELAAPIAELLGRARNIISSGEPFDPAHSARRFTIGAPDAVAAVMLPPFLARLQQRAPGIDISLRQLLPVPDEISPDRAWRPAFRDLESRAMDIAIIPSEGIPPRFVRHCIYEEDFVIAMRAGHPLGRDPTLRRYCGMRHLVVSHSGDPQGFVDRCLAKHRLSRRVSLTVPHFMFALAVLGETDFVSALPRRFVSAYAARFGVEAIEVPVPLPKFRLHAVAQGAAMSDAGVSWLFDLLSGAEPAARGSRQPPIRRKRRT